MYDFGYIDPSRRGWQAKAGLLTDGASIPSWAQPIIGGSWDKEFIKAAVIHDWYCIRTVRTRQATHRMFYDALIESGVFRAKALTMYYAVVVGSHMWISLIEGRPCSGVENCIQKAADPSATMTIIRSMQGRRESMSVPDGSSSIIIKRNEAGELIAYRGPRFSDLTIAADIAEADLIISSGSIKTPEEVDALALMRHPNDFLLQAGDALPFEGPSSKYPDR